MNFYNFGAVFESATMVKLVYTSMDFYNLEARRERLSHKHIVTERERVSNHKHIIVTDGI